MAQCENCKHLGFVVNPKHLWCRKENHRTCETYMCDGFEYNTERGFDDELDEYLFENHQVKSGCCSSVENLKYQIAHEVAEKMIEEFDIDIQYVSQEERRKKMNEMYGINSIK